MKTLPKRKPERYKQKTRNRVQNLPETNATHEEDQKTTTNKTRAVNDTTNRLKYNQNLITPNSSVGSATSM